MVGKTVVFLRVAAFVITNKPAAAVLPCTKIIVRDLRIYGYVLRILKERHYILGSNAVFVIAAVLSHASALRQ